MTNIIPKDLIANMALSWQPILSVDDITQAQWQQLSDHDSPFSTPFLSYAFLKGLEQTQCVDGKTGWHSYHVGIYSSGAMASDVDVTLINNRAIENQNTSESNELNQASKQLIGFIPCYLKTHSYGEYVFDHAWANAYQHHQVPYYPKLVACIPFTPVTGSRLLMNLDAGYTFAQINQFIGMHIDDILIQARASSFHYLFLPESQSNTLSEYQLLQRLSVQFVWQNQAYSSFDDFMQKMTSRKRRSIRKERARALIIPVEKSDLDTTEMLSEALRDNKMSNEPIQIKRLAGEDLSAAVMADFYLCYQQTYLKRSGHSGYLSEAFFDYLLSQMRNNIMIVMAYHSNKCIASALFFYNEEQLFGRYWGALQEVSGLHFECCYYQGIEFAIEKKLRQFNPGTQGEHKILRGFEPTLCYSNHYLQHPDFQAAVADFLKHERIGVQQYKQQGERVLPFKQN